MRHTRALGINLNAHARELKHMDVQYLPEGHEYSSAKHHLTCKVTEKVVGSFLNSRGDTAQEPKRCSVEDVHVGSALSTEQRERVRRINQRHKEVFALSPDDLPP